MPHVLIRNIEPALYKRLEARTRRNARSLGAELHLILQQAAVELEAETGPIPAMQAEVRRVRALFGGGRFSDSTELLREDRGR